MSNAKPSSRRKTPQEVFDHLCASIRAATHVEDDGEGNVRLELPLQYPNGEPIAISLLPDGRLGDDGVTLLRLMRDNQLDAFSNWPEFPAYLKNHNIVRDGSQLTLEPKAANQLIFFLEGLRTMELVVPRAMGRSTAFDDQVRQAVRTQLELEAKANRVSESVVQQILNPTLQARVRRQDTAQPVTVSVDADFQSKDKRKFYVVLSYGGATHGERMAHLSVRLVNHVLMRTDENNPKVKTFAIIPKDGNYSSEELDAVALYTGNDPVPIDPKRDTKRFVRSLFETGKGPF